MNLPSKLILQSALWAMVFTGCRVIDNDNNNGGDGSGDSAANVDKYLTQEFLTAVTQDSAKEPGCFESALNKNPLGQALLTRFPKEAFLADGKTLAHNHTWYYTLENFKKGIKAYPKFMDSKDDNLNRVELAALFAHMNQETGSFPSKHYYGIGCAIEENYGGALGISNYTDPNHPAPSPSGYIGRGPHQLSWNYNYKSFGDEVGEDTLGDPDLLTLEPILGITASLWFWNHEEPSWQGGGKLFKPSSHNVIQGNWEPTENDILAGRTKARAFGVTTNIINGGNECIGGGNTPAAKFRVETFKKYLELLDAKLPDGWEDFPEQDCSKNQRNFADMASWPKIESNTKNNSLAYRKIASVSRAKKAKD